jgi:hypothetical protein
MPQDTEARIDGEPEVQDVPDNTGADMQDAGEILPESNDPSENKSMAENAKLMEQFQEMQVKLAVIEKEKELADKRVKDMQNEFHKKRDGRDGDAPDIDRKPKETLDQYTERLTDMLSDDPQQAFRSLIKDIIVDKQNERVERERMLREAEERMQQRFLKSDPQRAKLLDEAENLAAERPDLANLTFDQRLEFVELRQAKKQGAAKADDGDNGSERARAAQALLSGSRRRSSADRSGLPEWTADPDAQKLAKAEGFDSRQEMAAWADINSAEDAERIMRQKR